MPCYFIHGNRDFLLGPNYAERAALQLLPETFIADLYGTPSLLLHGDTLCTDDKQYQDFRRQVRDPEFQSKFLDMPPEQRLEMAQNARDASKQHTGNAATKIMDVNQAAVCDAFDAFGLKRMIHGHTHRPAFHQHELPDGSSCDRWVLADWYSRGSYLRVGPDSYDLLPISASV